MSFSMDDMLRPASSVGTSTRVEGPNEALAGPSLALFLSNLQFELGADEKPICTMLPQALETINAKVAEIENDLRDIEANAPLTDEEISALAKQQFSSSYGDPALVNDALAYLHTAAENHGSNTWLNPADSHGVKRHRQRKVALFAIRPFVGAESHRQIDKAISLCKC